LEVLIWFLPVAFFIHDGEEIATMEKWLRNHKDQPRIAAENRLLNWEKNITFQFTVAVLLIGASLCLVTYFAAKDFGSGSKLNSLFSGSVAVLLLDGIKHVGFTVVLKKYTSGVITAALVEIPYAAYALYRFYEAGTIDVMTILTGIAIVLPLTLLLVWSGLTLGRMVAPYRKHA
jgi:hypothetical protein